MINKEKMIAMPTKKLELKDQDQIYVTILMHILF